jgi:hypothetical protein
MKALLLPKNEHGHVVITVNGLNLTGAEELKHGENNKFRFGVYAKQMLISTKPDSYDVNHRLENGKQYQIALIPSKEILNSRTIADARLYVKKCGYLFPRAGITQRVREAISDKQMEAMEGIWYIATLHDPIMDDDGKLRILGSARYSGGPWIIALGVGSKDAYGDDGSFAVLAP